eukprot:15587128-Heterocapsa_arctica.AAC.1
MDKCSYEIDPRTRSLRPAALGGLLAFGCLRPARRGWLRLPAAAIDRLDAVGTPSSRKATA